jgi:hypothetical protein
MELNSYKIYNINEPRSIQTVFRGNTNNNEINCTIPFGNTKIKFQEYKLCNPEYGFIIVQSDNIIDESHPSEFDNWDHSLKSKHFKTKIFGSIKDLKLFEELFVINKEFSGYIKAIYIEDINIQKETLLKYRVNDLNNYIVYKSNGSPLTKNNNLVYRFHEFVTDRRYYIDKRFVVYKNEIYPHIEQIENSNLGRIRFKKDYFQIINNNYLIKSSLKFSIVDDKKSLEIFVKDGYLINALCHYDLFIQEFPKSKIPSNYLSIFNNLTLSNKKKHIKKINKKIVRDLNDEIIVFFIEFKKKNEIKHDNYLEYKFDIDLINKEYFIDPFEYSEEYEESEEEYYDHNWLIKDGLDDFYNVDPDWWWNID